MDLERELRRLRWATGLTWLALALAIAWTAWPRTTWTGQRIEVVSEDGVVRGTFSAEPDGARLSLRDGIVLETVDGTPELRIGDEGGTVVRPGRVVLGTPDAGVLLDADTATARLRARGGSASLEANADGGRLVLTDPTRERIYTVDGP